MAPNGRQQKGTQSGHRGTGQGEFPSTCDTERYRVGGGDPSHFAAAPIFPRRARYVSSVLGDLRVRVWTTTRRRSHSTVSSSGVYPYGHGAGVIALMAISAIGSIKYKLPMITTQTTAYPGLSKCSSIRVGSSLHFNLELLIYHANDTVNVNAARKFRSPLYQRSL